MKKALIRLRKPPEAPDLSPTEEKYFIEEGDVVENLPHGVVQEDYDYGRYDCSDRVRLFIPYTLPLSPQQIERKKAIYQRALLKHKKWTIENADLIDQELERRMAEAVEKKKKKTEREIKSKTATIKLLESEITSLLSK